MAKQPSIEELMAQLGGMSYSAPSSYKGYQSGITKPIGYKSIDLDAYDFTQDSFGSLKKEKKDKKSGLKPDFWGMISGTLGLPGGIITDTAYSQLEAFKRFGDGKGTITGDVLNLLKGMSPTAVGTRMAVNGGKEQMKKWKDGELSWGDVPGIGFLHGVDKGFKRGKDIAEDHLGADSKLGRVGGGIAIDIALDPLTYLTGGLSLAGKAGKVAEAAEIANQARKLGMATTKFKTADEFIQAAETVVKQKYQKYPNLVDKMVSKKMEEAGQAIKAARAKAYNGNINKWGFSVPFSNKLSGAVGDIKPGSMLYRSEATLGSQYKHLADDLLAKAADGDAQKLAQLQNVVKARYGVQSIQELTKTHFEDLNNTLKPFFETKLKGMPDANVVENMVQKSMPDEIFDIASKKGRPNETVTYSKMTSDDIMKQLQAKNPKVASQLEPMIRGLDDLNDIRKYAPEASEMFGEFARKIMKTVKGKTAKNVEEAFKEAADILRNVSHTGSIAKNPDIVWKELERVVEVFKKGNPAKTKPLKNKEFYKNVANVTKNEFSELSNGRTSFEHWLDRKNPFDARTLKTGDKFLDSMANHIADANSMRVGETAKYIKGLSEVQKYVRKNKLTENDMMEAIYHLEKQAPKSFGADWQASDKAKGLAEVMKRLLDNVGADDLASGNVSKLRENYFPHVVNRSDDDLKAMMEFDERSGLNGLSAENKFDKARKSFQTIADRDDYMAKLSKEISKATDPAQKEALEEQLKRVENLFDTDVVSALQRRVRDGVRAKAMKEMQTNLKKYGMMDTKPGKGLVQLDAKDASKLGLKNGPHYMNPKVFEGLKKTDEIFTDQGMNKVARHLAAISDIWRPLVTYYKPSHYRNNLLGNAINNLAAGVTMSDYKVAGKLISGWRKGKLTDAQMKIMHQAYKHNVVSGGFLFDSQPTFLFDQPTFLETIAKKVGNNPVVDRMRTSGEFFDDYTRLANFVGGISKYGKADRAAQQVREYLFNYNELTNADRAMRVVVPFWNWTKRNLPLQMKLLMENPKFVMNNERFRNLFNDEEEGADWQKASGIKLTDDYYTSIPNPSSDLEMLTNPRSFLGSLNPGIKMPLEMAMNKKMYTGKPISYGSDDMQAEDILSYLASNLGIGGSAYDAFSGKKTAGESLMNFFNPITKIHRPGEEN